MRVGTIRQSTVTDFAIGGAICPKCKQPFTAQMNRTIQTATMLAVPFMKKTGERYTICPHCGLRYSFTPDMYSSLRQRPTADFLYQICSGMLLQGQEKAEKHGARSRKNAGLAAVLALLLGVFGAQNWYLGHYKRALIACILDALGLVCFFAALAVENAQPLAVSRRRPVRLQPVLGACRHGPHPSGPRQGRRGPVRLHAQTACAVDGKERKLS